LLETPGALNTNEIIKNTMDFKGELSLLMIWACVAVCVFAFSFGLVCNFSDAIWIKMAGCCYKKELEKAKELKSSTWNVKGEKSQAEVADMEGFDNIVMTERDAPIVTEPGTALD
jgi:hypothetical protein